MSLYPRTSASGPTLLAALNDVYNKSINAADPANVIGSYLTWVADSLRALRMVMRPEDLDRLVLTPRYWATLNSPAPSHTTNYAVAEEVAQRQTELRAAMDELTQVLRPWEALKAPHLIAVADTNVFLHHSQMFDDIDWHQLLGDDVRPATPIMLCIPLLVIDELDDAKRESVRTRARMTLKNIYTIFADKPTSQGMLTPADSDHGAVTIELLFDNPHHVRLPRPDVELVDRCLALQALTDTPVHFLSFDTGAALRAKAAGLKSQRLQHAPERDAPS